MVFRFPSPSDSNVSPAPKRKPRVTFPDPPSRPVDPYAAQIIAKIRSVSDRALLRVLDEMIDDVIGCAHLIPGCQQR